jgi:hypothetical protein
MEVRWHEASFRLAVSPWNFHRLVLLAIVACATGATALFLAPFFDARLLQPEPMILLAGIGLRYIYVFGTPYFVRSFDYWGHAAYLDYVSQHLRLPPPSANWEAFQAPLYYLIAGGITRAFLLLGMAEDERYVLWQVISLLFSIGLLEVGYVIAAILYERSDRRRFYMLAVFAVAPPLVFELACGLSLLTVYFCATGLLSIISLHILFLLALLAAAVRGLPVDCGCFGGQSWLDANPWAALLRDGALLTGAVYAYRYCLALELERQRHAKDARA